MNIHKEINDKISFINKIVINILFGSKWLLVIFYLGLILAQCFYCIKFCQEVYHLSFNFWKLSENELMLIILTLIDITMIANLIKMIITGSYQTFVQNLDDAGTEKVSSGLLKVKMGSSLVGVSSIHLLQTFIDSNSISDRDIFIKCAIHVIFLISTVGLAYISKITQH